MGHIWAVGRGAAPNVGVRVFVSAEVPLLLGRDRGAGRLGHLRPPRLPFRGRAAPSAAGRPFSTRTRGAAGSPAPPSLRSPSSGGDVVVHGFDARFPEHTEHPLCSRRGPSPLGRGLSKSFAHFLKNVSALLLLRRKSFIYSGYKSLVR